ncbi:MAG: hypothetical protein CSA22_07495 [Deltaproteobacteria bacterium]|nr:MAG: hypothetical protein CSA22_07495 [Deltaproteobacteria bacterium]
MGNNLQPAHQRIVGHRGAMSVAPQNTKAAFDLALETGVWGLECDVQLSADGIPVIFHDPVVTTEGDSLIQIPDLTLEELKRFDWGDRRSARYRDEPLLTLDALLAAYGHRTALLIEIKGYDRNVAPKRMDQLVDATLDSLNRFYGGPWPDTLYVLSFEHEILTRAHGAYPDGNYVQNIVDPHAVIRGMEFCPQFLMAYSLDIERLTGEFTAFAKAQGKQLMTYTSNTPDTADKAIRLGVDVMMTDHPEWLQAYLKGTDPP